jgi:hypothetical protein
MKKTLVAFISLLSFSFMLVPTASADFDITTIRGEIMGPDGQPFKRADVSITCDGETKTDRTNNQGKYRVRFFGTDHCDVGDVASITVSKDGLTGSATGTVEERRDGRFVDRNFSVVDFAVNVPEFGLLTGAAAALTSVGAFLTLRRRKV